MAQVSTMSHCLFMVGIGKGVEKVSEVTMIIFFCLSSFVENLQRYVGTCIFNDILYS